MKRYIDISGQVFGLLTVVGPSDRRGKSGDMLWNCLCRCGGDHVATGSHLRSGDVTSCGCAASRNTIGRRQAGKALQQSPIEYLAKHSTPDGDCVIWNSALTDGGYGAAWVRGRYVLAHRLAYAAFKGAIPAGKFVCHTCDRPACIKPGHLWLGDHQDNMTDKVSKDRHSHGEVHGMAKLDDAAVRLILQSTISANELAEQFGVTPEHISVIRAGKAWKHIHLELSRV